MRVLLLCALVACTYPEKEFEFECFGQPAATTAPPLVHIGGTTLNASNKVPVPSVKVELQSAQGVTIFTTTSDAFGSFNFDLTTMGVPVSGLDLHSTAADYLESYYFPNRSISDDVDLKVSMIPSAQEVAIAAGAGLTFTPGQGVVLLGITDCTDTVGLPRATLTSNPPGDVRYFDSVQPSMVRTETDSGGVAMIANLPPGKVTLTAMVEGRTLPTVDVTVIADQFSLTAMQP